MPELQESECFPDCVGVDPAETLLLQGSLLWCLL